MSNAFKDWTPEMVERHNQRLGEQAIIKRFTVTGSKQCGKTAAQEEAVAALSTNLVIQPSTDEKKLNKLEKAWLRQLRLLNFPWIGIQAITLKLADDTRYTPDFMVIDANGQLVAYETKGWMRDDAAVKIKVAARKYPFIRFVLVTKEKGQWKETPVNP